MKKLYIKRLIFNLINGIYSGIPLCCTLFYAKKDLNIDPLLAYTVEKNRGIEVELVDHGFRYINGKNNCDYVSCDRCFNMNRFKTIKNNGMIFKWLIK